LASEKNFENKIKGFLKEHNSWFLKYWGGGQFTKSGVPDILACVNGFFVGIEVKAKNGKPSPLQIHNLESIDDSGGAGILLYPDDYEIFTNFVECLNAGDLVNAQLNYEILKGRWKEWKQAFK